MDPLGIEPKSLPCKGRIIAVIRWAPYAMGLILFFTALATKLEFNFVCSVVEYIISKVRG